MRYWTGHEARALRLALRLSVRSFAAALGISARTVSKWERAGSGTNLRPDSHALLDTTLRRADDAAQGRFDALLTAGDLRRVDASSAPGRQNTPNHPVGPPTLGRDDPSRGPDHTREFNLEDDDVQRRQFLAGLASVGFAGSVSLATGLEALRHGVIADAGGEGADLNDWEAITWEYGRTYATTPPQALLESLIADLQVASAQLSRLRTDSAERDLRRVIAHLAAFTAQTLSNLGNTRASHRWWRAARQAADAADHPETRVWVRGREIIRGLYEHRPVGHLLHLCDEAIAITAAPGTGTGSVLMGRAQALAMVGARDQATQALRQLYAVLDRLPDHVTTDTDTMYGWPEYRLRHGQSFVYTHLNEQARAKQAHDTALSLYPPHMFRERALVQLHRALGMVRYGDVTTGTNHARQIVTDLPENHRIDMVLELARAVSRAVPDQQQRRPEVTNLNDVLALPSSIRH
jgi:hypothetical protein